MIDEQQVFERVMRGFVPPDDSLERLVHRRDRKRRNQRIAAGVVGIAVFVAAVLIVTSGGWFDRSAVHVVPRRCGDRTRRDRPDRADDRARSGGVVGLPLQSATPSTPEHGRLVLYLEGSRAQWTAMSGVRRRPRDLG